MAEADIAEVLIEAATDFLVELRTFEGFDTKKFERLCEVLRQFREAWREYEYVPKDAVNVMLDLFPVPWAVADHYANRNKGADPQGILDAGITLNSLAKDCMDLPDNGRP